MTRLVVISNRVARPQGSGGSQGGLAVALMSALDAYGGIWLGWDGKKAGAAPRRPRLQEHGNITFATLPLTHKDYHEYYRGYSNSVLWPLLHYQLSNLSYEREFETGYRRVNRRFAHAVLPLLRSQDIIWVNDYHFIPLGRELRTAGVTQPIGFFLHTPFPTIDVLRALPGYEDLLRSMLAYNLVGLQTQQDKLAFIDAVKDMTPDLKRTKDVLAVGKHRVRTCAYPVGVDVEEVVAMATKGRASKQNKQLAASMIDRRSLVIGVDRLDYSKGLPQRFRAFERLLARYPANWGRVEYLQIAAPSRSDVPEYAAIRRQIDAIAGQVNARFGDYYWTPLRYLNKGFARATILGFLSISRVGLVTPLRDGMNLVAKEFIAAQPAEDPGVLVLSCMAGAAVELREALLVNPYDIDSVADAIQAGLCMSLRERKRRWRLMMEVLRDNNIQRWFMSFLRSLEAAGSGPGAPLRPAASGR